MHLLLARGRDRLETRFAAVPALYVRISYSLGDAIDWKQYSWVRIKIVIRDLLLARGRDRLETFGSVSPSGEMVDLLLARGRDRLETSNRRSPICWHS